MKKQNKLSKGCKGVSCMSCNNKAEWGRGCFVSIIRRKPHKLWKILVAGRSSGGDSLAPLST